MQAQKLRMFPLQTQNILPHTLSLRAFMFFTTKGSRPRSSPEIRSVMIRRIFGNMRDLDGHKAGNKTKFMYPNSASVCRKPLVELMYPTAFAEDSEAEDMHRKKGRRPQSSKVQSRSCYVHKAVRSSNMRSSNNSLSAGSWAPVRRTKA